MDRFVCGLLEFDVGQIGRRAGAVMKISTTRRAANFECATTVTPFTFVSLAAINRVSSVQKECGGGRLVAAGDGDGPTSGEGIDEHVRPRHQSHPAVDHE